jgi:ATP-dependent protease ClpP protease subunit
MGKEIQKNVYGKHTLFTHATQSELFIGGFECDDSELQELSQKLRYSKIKKLDVLINSSGGYLNEMIVIDNLLQGLDCDVTYILEAAAHSSGSLLFCSGSGDRIVNPYCSMEIHAPTLGGSSNTASNIQAIMNNSLKISKQMFKDIYLDKGYITQDEYDKLAMGMELCLDCQDMCMRGICTHVDLGYEVMTAREYMLYKNKEEK